MLHNADGDSLLLTVDHFALVEPTAAEAVYTTLASLEGAQCDGDDAVVFL